MPSVLSSLRGYRRTPVRKSQLDGGKHEDRCEWRQRPFGQSRCFGAVAASQRARGRGHHAYARNRLWTGSGTIRGLQPTRKPCGGLCGPRSSAHHHDRRSGTRKARSAERRRHRRGREGGRQAHRLHVGRGHAAGGGAGARRLLLAGRTASHRHGAGLDHPAHETSMPKLSCSWRRRRWARAC